jgi:alpha-L-arabinofuranosidase
VHRPCGVCANPLEGEAKRQRSWGGALCAARSDVSQDHATVSGPVTRRRGCPACRAYASSAKAWIDYVNNNPSHPEWSVEYFKIGNEVWGCGGNLEENEASYEPWYTANEAVLSTPVNGKELFLVAGTAGIWTVNPNDANDWINKLLGNLGDQIDGIEIHDYLYFPNDIPCVGFSEDQYYNIVYLADEGQMRPRIKDIRTIMDKNDPEGRIRIIEDEWGDWLMPRSSPAQRRIATTTLARRKR